MKLHLQFEDRKIKGKNGRKPRKAKVMYMTLRTELEGMESISAVAEVPPGTPLYKEVENITVELLAAKKKSLSKEEKVI